MAEPHSLREKLKVKLDYEQLTNCMRCGFCLPACPTFIETGYEAESPRGRIALMKAVADGLMDPDQAFEDQMNHCLGCRACEPACPADVKYGQLIEQARDAIEDHVEHGFWIRFVRKLAFQQMFPYRSRMRLLGALMRAYQKSGLQLLTQKLGVLKLFPTHMREMEAILPEAGIRGVVEQLGTWYPAKGEPIARVGMFRGCIMDVLFAETNVNTVKLLAEAGFEVVIPNTQNCCGALHAHSGELAIARDLARQNIQAFQEENVDYIVSNAGGCGAILVEYDHLLQDDQTWQETSKWFASKVKDISELLWTKGRIPEFSESSRDIIESMQVTYQDSCHLKNVMKSSTAPRQLIKRVEHVTFVEAKEAEQCCGSAGIYNLTQPQMANQILAHKMAHMKQTNAHYLVTSNPGCLLQMKLGIEKYKPVTPMKALHIVDFLYERIVK